MTKTSIRRHIGCWEGKEMDQRDEDEEGNDGILRLDRRRGARWGSGLSLSRVLIQ